MRRLMLFAIGVLCIACQNDEPVPAVGPKDAVTKTDESPDRNPANGKIGNHTYWYFYRSVSHTYLRSAYSDDGITWSGNVQFNNSAGSYTSPAVAFFNNKFVAVFRGGSTTNMYFCSSTDGLNWSAYTQIPGIVTSQAPSMVKFDNKLWVFYSVPTGNQYFLYYITSTNGTTWSAPTAIKEPGGSVFTLADGPPTAVVDETNNEIYLIYPRAITYFDYRLTLRKLDGTSWIYPLANNYITTVSGAKVTSRTTVGACFVDGKLHVAYKDYDNDKVQIYIGNSLDAGFSINLGGYTEHGPSMVYFNGKFTVVYRGLTSNNIFIKQSSDGVTWSAQIVGIGQTTNGGPRIIAG